jgi:hypothetical protein
MPEVEDWLQDPLKSHQLKTTDNKQNDLWQSFHFATRLKLDGADHFCRQALGAASMSYRKGLPLLAHRQLEWYLAAFFFELMSAYDTLLQELNIIYAGLKPDDVRWSDKNKTKFMKKLPPGILDCIEEGRKKDWFDRIRNYRITATHHSLIPIGLTEAWWGDDSLDSSHHVHIYYRDKDGKFKSKEIKACKDYLNDMVKHIRSVWEKMLPEFQ